MTPGRTKITSTVQKLCINYSGSLWKEALLFEKASNACLQSFEFACAFSLFLLQVNLRFQLPHLARPLLDHSYLVSLLPSFVLQSSDIL